MTEQKKEKIYNDWKNGNGDDRQAFKNMSKLEMLEFIVFCARFERCNNCSHSIIDRMLIALERS